ncbi:MAG: hypothetical protein ACPGEF_04485 [Endozoicomonas sp.]
MTLFLPLIPILSMVMAIIQWDSSNTFDKGLKQVQQALEIQDPELGGKLLSQF